MTRNARYNACFHTVYFLVICLISLLFTNVFLCFVSYLFLVWKLKLISAVLRLLQEALPKYLIDFNKLNRDSDESLKRAKNRIYFRHGRSTPDDLRPLKKLLDSFNKNTKQKNSVSNKPIGQWAKNFTSSKNQQCTVKFRYSDSVQAHKKYLEYYMPQKNEKDVKNKPEYFGNITKEEYRLKIISEKKVIRKKTKRVSRNYKFILSPEEFIDDDLILKEFTKCFVSRMELKMGVHMDWQAVIHRNTPHPHVHLLINGKDKKGKDFRFPREIIRNYCHEASQEILTHMLGERSQDLIRQAKEREANSTRWTKLDQMIFDNMKPVDDLNLENEYSGKCTASDPDLRKRMIFLSEWLGLADYKNEYFYFKKDWEETVKFLGKYNMYLDGKKHVTPGTYYQMYKPEMGEIEGRIKYNYTMNDEDVWNNALVIENEKDKKAYYVPLYNPVYKQKPGDIIRLKVNERANGLLDPKIEKIHEQEIDR